MKSLKEIIERYKNQIPSYYSRFYGEIRKRKADKRDGRESVHMDHKKVHELRKNMINRIPNGGERYMNEPMINQCINVIAAGKDPFDVLINVIDHLNEVTKRLEELIMLNPGFPVVGRKTSEYDDSCRICGKIDCSGTQAHK